MSSTNENGPISGAASREGRAVPPETSSGALLLIHQPWAAVYRMKLAIARLVCRVSGHDMHWDDNFCLRCERCGQWVQYEVRG